MKNKKATYIFLEGYERVFELNKENGLENVQY